MDEKEQNSQKRKGLTKKEKEEATKLVNKMTDTYEYIKSTQHNMTWMAPDWDPHFKGLPAGLTFIHTKSLINLTRWLTGLTITLIVLTIVHVVIILFF